MRDDVHVSTGKAVALLPDRAVGTLGAWLKAYRARRLSFGAPDATQVADHWHQSQPDQKLTEKTVAAQCGCLEQGDVLEPRDDGVRRPRQPTHNKLDRSSPGSTPAAANSWTPPSVAQVEEASRIFRRARAARTLPLTDWLGPTE